MKYLLDTHTIYWFFENPEKLGSKSYEILKDENSQLLIPSIVIAELKYIFKKYRILDDFEKVFSAIIDDNRCFIIPLDANIIKRMPGDFEIHDSIIVASAKYFEEFHKEEILVITRDRKIKSSELIKIIW